MYGCACVFGGMISKRSGSLRRLRGGTVRKIQVSQVFAVIIIMQIRLYFFSIIVGSVPIYQLVFGVSAQENNRIVWKSGWETGSDSNKQMRICTFP